MEIKKNISKVTETERNEIKNPFERKNGLSELFKIADAENLGLYNKIVTDMGKTSDEFPKWLDEKSKQYKWESVEGFSWEINFDNCEICLVRK